MTLNDGRGNALIHSLFSPYLTVVLAFVLFYCADIFLKHGFNCFKRIPTSETALARLRNYSLSVFHALASGFGALICLLVCEDFLEDIVTAENDIAYHLIGFSTGYFFHDIYHNICTGLCSRSLEIILHHITVVTSFVIVIQYRILVPYALFGLLMELNSIFLHGRHIMLYFDVDPHSVVYQTNFKANIVTFVIFRILLTPGMYIWAIVNRRLLPVFDPGASCMGSHYMAFTVT
ncbi:hypothetical protein CRM22_002339 [Opisthorchis felineus]|uniref:TLC domain-containing protein n=1 Tax=Opisthorchis felineus TaxID=147828 RepID=A0A4S2M6E3_OPIFE|nr:hypothetical protein CRM22_002339 [Opisthorchis felineus]